MFFPLRTDAPVYHTPYATIGVIAVCVVVSVGSWFGMVDADALALDYAAFRPDQWVTSNFLHAGIVHLAGNMIFLWTFGLIVEGKVGWWRYLVIFLAIGVPQCAVEQLLFSEGVSYGASAIVFGMMGISLVWAPVHDITWVWVFLPFYRKFDAKVRTAAICWTAWELFGLGLGFLTFGFAVTSGLLHLMGLAVGIPVGVWMLRNDLVDCEGWDWFSVRRGDHLKGTYSARRMAAARKVSSARGESRSLFDGDGPDPIETLRSAIVSGDAGEASLAAKAVREPLRENDLRQLGNLLYRTRDWDAAATVLAEYVGRFPGRSARTALRLAHVRVAHQTRPKAALEALTTIPPGTLDVAEQRWHDDLTAKAEALATETPLEFDDEAW